MIAQGSGWRRASPSAPLRAALWHRLYGLTEHARAA